MYVGRVYAITSNIMEIPVWSYLSFWAIISLAFLHLGFIALDRTGLSLSVHPLVMSFFKHSLAISTCHCSIYALIFSRHVKLSVDRRYFWAFFGTVPYLFYRPLNPTALWGFLAYFIIRFSAWVLHFLPKLTIFHQRYSLILTVTFLSSELYGWFFPISTLINSLLIWGEFYRRPELEITTRIHMALETSLFLVSGKSTEFYPILVLFISYLTSAYWAGISGLEPYTLLSGDPGDDQAFQELLSMAEKLKDSFLALKNKMAGKWIEFAIGMVGTILFQYYFRLTSFHHVVAFLYVAMVWVANITLVGGGSGDLGIFNFLLGNVIVGCTVSQFGLQGTTWIVYGVSLLLFGLRLKIESLIFVNREGEQDKVVLW